MTMPLEYLGILANEDSNFKVQDKDRAGYEYLEE